MRSTHLLCFFAAISLLGSIPAWANVTVSIDLDANTAGIQDNINVVVGDTITGAIVLNVTGDTRFSAYDFILDFEQDTLAYGPNTLMGKAFDPVTGERNVDIDTNRVNLGVSGIISISPVVVFDLGPLTEDTPLTPPVPDMDPIYNSITGIAGGTSGERLGTGVFGDVNEQIYQFTLTATSVGTSTLSLRGGAPTFLDEDALGAVSFLGGTVNITTVPEPTTLVACSLGLGLVAAGQRRRKRRANAQDK